MTSKNILDQREFKARELLAMHGSANMLVLPNAWDGASARVLALCGFKALATTSAGIAFSRGYPDGECIPRAEMMAAVRVICRAFHGPVTADLEGGYGPSPDDVFATVTDAIDAGAVGCNLEDGAHTSAEPLISLEEMLAKLTAAREAAKIASVPSFVINARVDVYFCGNSGPEAFDETVSRARAYLAAGADSIFIPGPTEPSLIRNLALAVRGPLNILGTPAAPTISELRALGVKRVTIGGGLMRSMLSLIRHSGEALHNDGTFEFLKGAIPHSETNQMFAGIAQ